MTRQGKWVLGGVLAAIALIVGVSLIAPSDDENDSRPSTYNPGRHGAKAAYLLLGKLGYQTSRYSRGLKGLSHEDAAHETLLLTNPWGAGEESERATLADFIHRGGRVVGVGYAGMVNLPGVYWLGPDVRLNDCYSKPEGTSALAAAGSIEFHPETLARVDLVETHVAQRCKEGAAVIEYDWGAGHVVWWADQSPLTNYGLHDDANLKLLLASVGPFSRKVLFDESSDELPPSRGMWDGADGLPFRALAWQLLVGVLLLLWSFGRRHGPTRALVTTPRTSPLEFAYSMGNLYNRGNAGEAALQEACARLLRVVEKECGVSRDILSAGPDAMAHELQQRFNFKADDFTSLLQRAQRNERISPAEALPLVRRVNDIIDDLRTIVSRIPTLSTQEKTLV